MDFLTVSSISCAFHVHFNTILSHFLAFYMHFICVLYHVISFYSSSIGENLRGIGSSDALRQRHQLHGESGPLDPGARRAARDGADGGVAQRDQLYRGCGSLRKGLVARP